MIRGVIFDIDGTLYDWETSLERALEGILREVPAAQRPGLPARLRRALADYAHVVRDGQVVDRRYWMLFLDPVPPWTAALAGGDKEQVRGLARRFRSLLEPVAYADARPVLEALRGDYGLGVLSNSPRTVETVARLELSGYFDAVASAPEDQRKPHRDAFLRACRALGVQPAEAAYVGDSLMNDVEGALAAGLVSVWIDRYGEEYPLSEAAHRVSSLAELPALLPRLA